jgi:CheY-like chemotaxis protein
MTRVNAYVLVVDDDPGFAGLTTRMIAALGLGEVVQAGTYAAALEAAERFEPAAALVDVGLPDGDGVELAARLAAAAWAPRVVLTSSDPDAAARSRPIPFIAKHDLLDVDLRSLLTGAGG